MGLAVTNAKALKSTTSNSATYMSLSKISMKTFIKEPVAAQANLISRIEAVYKKVKEINKTVADQAVILENNDKDWEEEL